MCVCLHAHVHTHLHRVCDAWDSCPRALSNSSSLCLCQAFTTEVVPYCRNLCGLRSPLEASRFLVILVHPLANLFPRCRTGSIAPWLSETTISSLLVSIGCPVMVKAFLGPNPGGRDLKIPGSEHDLPRSKNAMLKMKISSHRILKPKHVSSCNLFRFAKWKHAQREREMYIYIYFYAHTHTWIFANIYIYIHLFIYLSKDIDISY